MNQSPLNPKRFAKGATCIETHGANAKAAYYAGAWLKNNEWLLFISQDSRMENTDLSWAVQN